MENYGQQLKSRGATLETDASPATRLSQRPASSQGGGAHYENLGSDFGKKPARGRSRAPSAPRHLPVKGTSRHGSVTLVGFTDDDDAGVDSSDDEIDFLSGSSRHGSVELDEPKRQLRRSNRSNAALAIDHHQTDPEYHTIDLTKMKIPKKYTAAPNPGTKHIYVKDPTPGPSSSSRPAGRAAKIPLAEHSRNRPRTRQFPNTSDDCEDEIVKGQGNDADRTPRPSRPVPRPVNKASKCNLVKSQTVPHLNVQSSQEKTSQPLSRSQTVNDIVKPTTLVISDSSSDDPEPLMPKLRSSGRSMGGDKIKRKTRAQNSAFPVISPLSEARYDRNTGPVAPSKSCKDKGKGKTTARAETIDNPFPLSSPVRTPRRSAPSSFPTISPLSSPTFPRATPTRVRANQLGGRLKTTVLSSSEDDDEPRRTIRPFPMDTQVLASIGRYSPASQQGTPDNGEESRGEVHGKKRRRESSQFDLSFDLDSDDDSEWMHPFQLAVYDAY